MTDHLAEALAVAEGEPTAADAVAVFLERLVVGELSAVFLTVHRGGRVETHQDLPSLGRAVRALRRRGRL